MSYSESKEPCSSEFPLKFKMSSLVLMIPLGILKIFTHFGAGRKKFTSNHKFMCKIAEKVQNMNDFK